MERSTPYRPLQLQLEERSRSSPSSANWDVPVFEPPPLSSGPASDRRHAKARWRLGHGRIREYWRYLPLLVLVLITAALPGVIARNIGKLALRGVDDCTPGGQFVGTAGLGRGVGTLIDPFAPTHLLTITLRLGSFDFFVSKSIDVVWDVVVGRGGQAILFYTAYRVFAKVLCCTMEKHAMSHRLYSSLAFEGVTFPTTWRLILDRQHWAAGWRARLTILGMILSSIYIISFPTLVSAMTGYATEYEAFIKVEECVCLSVCVCVSASACLRVCVSSRNHSWLSSSNSWSTVT